MYPLSPEEIAALDDSLLRNREKLHPNASGHINGSGNVQSN
jgi:hypothetical protein